ncbi:MAG TPA: hypothetical protein VFB73_05760 [Chloroflexota bacterium]|nr:hypothetical protein [Chloroflexota bacterium]
MIVAATLLVIILAVGALVLPLVRASKARTRPEDAGNAEAALSPPAAALLEEQETALEALRELDFEYALGKLAEADYRAMRARYEWQAIALRRAAERWEAPAGEPGPAAVDAVAVPRAPSPEELAARRNGVTARPAGAASRREQPRGAGGRMVLLAAAAVAVFVAGVAGLYTLMSRSQSVQRPVAVLEGVGPRALALSPAGPGPAFLASAAGLWRSSDAGERWQPVRALDALGARSAGSADGVPLRAVAVSPVQPQRVYAAGPGLLARSDDGGESWTRLSSMPPDAADLRALAVHPAEPDRLWVVVEGRGLFRSDDGGAHWTQTSSQVPANATALAAVLEAPSGAAGERLMLYLASATEGVLASADEGRGWAPASGVLNGALPTRRVTSLAFDAQSGDTATTPDGRILRGTLYAGTDAGLFRSIDRGQSWTRLPLAVPVVAVAVAHEAGAPLLLAVDQEGRVYRSRSRGVTWDGS